MLEPVRQAEYGPWSLSVLIAPLFSERSRVARRRCPGKDLLVLRSIELTTELRWFFDGPLPEHVRSWFTDSDTRGVVERRHDSYRKDDLVDLGVKRRFGSILEVKVRIGGSHPVVLGEVKGQLEMWLRRSPAARCLDIEGVTTWIDVDKTVTKRRFDTEGNEVRISDNTRSPDEQGCDVEIVDLVAGERQAWSLAISAFGEHDAQRGRLMQAWDRVIAGGDCERSSSIDFRSAESYGYPEWLAGGAGGHPRPSGASNRWSSHRH